MEEKEAGGYRIKGERKQTGKVFCITAQTLCCPRKFALRCVYDCIGNWQGDAKWR